MDLQAKLSAREIEIAETVGFGRSKKEAADFLGISTKTVDNTIQSIFSKIGISKCTELTIFCFCRKFNIPLSMCVPARQFIAACFLALFAFGEMNHTSDIYRVRRGRNRNTEVSIRARRRTEN